MGSRRKVYTFGRTYMLRWVQYLIRISLEMPAPQEKLENVFFVSKQLQQVFSNSNRILKLVAANS